MLCPWYADGACFLKCGVWCVVHGALVDVVEVSGTSLWVERVVQKGVYVAWHIL